MYRPQFPFPLAPAPCSDQRCQYSFDKTNAPVFLGTLAAGAQTGRVPLRIDKDADFFLRGIATQGGVSVRIEDTNGNAISDSENATQAGNFELPDEYSRTAGAGIVTLESGAGGIFAAAGGNFIVFLANQTAGVLDLTTCAVNLHGIKRFAAPACAAGE